MHTDEFNHHPAQLMMNSGVGRLGRPSVGSWVTYGLGSETQNLPGYVVLSAGTGASGGTSNWSSGFCHLLTAAWFFVAREILC